MKSVRCHHCGKSGHFAQTCRILLAGHPQTLAGASAFADFCKRTGTPRTYDSKVIAE